MFDAIALMLPEYDDVSFPGPMLKQMVLQKMQLDANFSFLQETWDFLKTGRRHVPNNVRKEVAELEDVMALCTVEEDVQAFLFLLGPFLEREIWVFNGDRIIPKGKKVYEPEYKVALQDAKTSKKGGTRKTKLILLRFDSGSGYVYFPSCPPLCPPLHPSPLRFLLFFSVSSVWCSVWFWLPMPALLLAKAPGNCCTNLGFV
eukprot:gb/GEZN01012438.1/.p1 GENE.gb/GEZN01012438.1/~~gb/GEZN01012438.1/.p1  ORF type:complete len:202 (+),score=30.77 gb/GEZN01012438.1/:435-1040(+)